MSAGASEGLKEAGNDAGHAMSLWARADVVARREIQTRRNELALLQADARLMQGEVQRLSEGLAAAVDGIEKHLEVHGDLGILGQGSSPVKAANVTAPVRMLTSKDDDGSQLARGVFSLLLMLGLAAKADPTVRA